MKEKLKLNNGKLIYAVILARSGSKTIKNKNIKKINNKPLICYPIQAALKSKFINETFVLTDSKKYAKISSENGASIPFIRPKNISGDHSTDLETFKFFYNWLNKSKRKKPDIIVHLRATAPLVNENIINRAVKQFILQKSDSMKSVEVSKNSPYKMWKKNKDGFLKPVIENKTKNEYWNFPRQKLPVTLFQNAQIDIFRADLLKKNTISGKKIIPFYLESLIDIDEMSDLKKAELLLKK